MRFSQAKDFTNFGDFITRELRTVTGNKQVWDAFICTARGAGPGGCIDYLIVANAVSSIMLASEPNIYVRLDKPNPALMLEDGDIEFDWDLVQSFEDQPSSENKRGIELLALHEILHWVLWRSNVEDNEAVAIKFEEKAYPTDRCKRREAINSMYFKKRVFGKGRIDFQCNAKKGK